MARKKKNTKRVKRPFSGSPGMRNTINTLRKTPCPECDGLGCLVCGETGELKSAYLRVTEDLVASENTVRMLRQTLLSRDEIITEQIRELATKDRELETLQHQIESLHGAITELHDEPLTPDEIRLIKNTRMMTQKQPVRVEGEEPNDGGPMERALRKVTLRGPGLGTIMFQYLEELEVEKCDHGPDGRCPECWERNRQIREKEKPYKARAKRKQVPAAKKKTAVKKKKAAGGTRFK